STVEDGGHVRRGYRKEDLLDLCREAGLMFDTCTFCSGFLSQKVTFLLRTLSKIHPLLGWAGILPLRALPPLMDPLVSRLIAYPQFSICLEAHKPSSEASGNTSASVDLQRL